MNAAHMIRRFEAGGFNRDQATCLAETIADEVESTVATREFVELAIGRATSRLATAEEVAALARDMATKDDLELMATKDDLKGLATEEFVERVVAQATAQMMTRMNEQTRWFAGIILVQTVAVLTAAVTITRVLGGG